MENGLGKARRWAAKTCYENRGAEDEVEEDLWEDVGKEKRTRERQSCRERPSARRGFWGLTAAVNEAGDRGEKTCNFCVSVFHRLDPVNI